MGQEEVAIAEAPEHADAGQAGIGGCLDVDVAVAHIDGILALGSQQAQGLVDGVRGRLATDACSLVLADGHLDLREEMSHELTGGRHHLVAHHCQPTATLTE